jgi:hypothetical protein
MIDKQGNIEARIGNFLNTVAARHQKTELSDLGPIDNFEYQEPEYSPHPPPTPPLLIQQAQN